MGHVITIDGEVSPAALGRTLPHEHLLIDGSVWIDADATRPVLAERDIHQETSCENVWRLRDNPYTYDNSRLDDVDLIAAEAERFYERGGGTIVDVTSIGLRRDPVGLLRLSRRTGLHVVAGCGYYVSHCHPDDMNEKSKTDVADEIVSDVREGIGTTGVQAGIIGEVGTTKEFLSNENEVTSVRGAAIAQQRTGAPITIHPPYNYQEAHDILDILEAEGADLENVVMGHLSDTIRDPDSFEYHASIGDRGVYLGFDDFGMVGHRGTSNDLFDKVENVGPLDEDRINRVVGLYEAGYEDQLLLSHDISRKSYLTKYGGHGYGHILRNIVPRLLKSSPKRSALSRDDVERLIVNNPQEVLTIAD